MSLIAELKRRNVIRMAGLYLAGARLLVQVAGTLLPVFEAPAWVMKTHGPHDHRRAVAGAGLFWLRQVRAGAQAPAGFGGDRAPRWGALHLAWGQALAKQERAAEAQARYRAAAEMDLSLAERKLLLRLRQSAK